MNDNFTPKKEKENNQHLPTIKISPVKVPLGAKQIGNYILGKTIGSGTYGKVHLGLHIPTGEKVAVKIIDKMKLHAKDLERIHREMQILKKIMHPSLIQLYEIIETEKSLLLIIEYMQNGELFNYIIERKKLSEEEACKIFHQIIDGIEYMHKIGIAHRDLKPQNILIDYDGRVKIIDFGLSNIYKKNQKLKTQCGSPCYAAPQMIEGKSRYDPILIDIWSAGIVLFAMLSGYLPFCDPDTSKLYKKILLGHFKCPSWVSQEAKDLVEKILIVNPSKRIKINQIVEHPWYKRYSTIKNVGIDTKQYKVPYQVSIIHNIQKMGVKIPNLTQLLENNTKNKQTALYYIIAKKMVKQGFKILSYFACQYFLHEHLEPFHNELIEGGQSQQSSTQIEVEAVSPVPIDPLENNAPETSSGTQLYTVKSTQFKSILDDFMNAEPRKENKQLKINKGLFYANNLDIRKKKQNLKLEQRQQTKQEKALTIAKIYKKVRCYTSTFKAAPVLPEINKTKKLIQSLDTASTYANPRRKGQIKNYEYLPKSKYSNNSFF